ncbi:MAG: YfiR family protein [Fluviicoccus sp.]|uniref:YfiR family protein n=1 Tax=Fluviicoccus sp. TaxID=2003552 RepID=UPI00271F4D97|nr:YfiR family protein [Fluviicoccus sp.]MDO8330948.1 YfiR family protein [Fluviicoccus sp.]
MKTAMLYYFMLYVTWPSTPDVFTLCHAGQPEDMKIQLSSLERKSIRGHSISLRDITGVSSLPSTCNMLLLGGGQTHLEEAWLEKARDQSVLTISENDSRWRNEVMIRLRSDNGQVGFEVKLKALSGSPLVFNSKLLRLAAGTY